MKRILIVTALAISLSVIPVFGVAQENQTQYETETVLEEVVVTATRLETPTREVGSSITVVTEEEIEQKQKTSVLEVLRSVPALDVVQQGGPGKTTSIFIRGAKSEHTLVLVDGVEMNDPTSSSRGFDFANLTTQNIERIEILRGPQSTLYGSDAIGGVINIITKRGEGNPSGFVSAEAGSFDTFIERAGASGAGKWVDYSLGVSRWDSEGISAANEDDGNEEEDGYGNTSISARLGVTPTETFEVDSVLRYIDSENDLDYSGGKGGDDPNYTQESEKLFLRAQGRLELFDGLWDQKLGVSLTDYDRKLRNYPDPARPDDLLRSDFDGQIVKFDWQHDLYLHETNTLTVGAETEEEKIDSDSYSEYLDFFGNPTSSSSGIEDESVRTNSFYLQDQLEFRDAWFTTFGLRVDDHDEYGTETTYRVTSAYLIREAGTKLKGSYGTGFKAPSLYQLYSPVYGNEDLDPEESTGWDIGVEQSLIENRVTLGATYFKNYFEDLIDIDYATFRYFNIDEAKSEGVEVFAEIEPIEDLSIRINYTYTDTEDETTGEELLRRAQDKFALDMNYRFLERGNVNLGLVYVGERDDIDPISYARAESDDYTLVNLAASYQVTETIELFGRVENLFDEEYEEVLGYGTPDLSAFAGVKLSF